MTFYTKSNVVVRATKLTEKPKLSDRRGNSETFCIFIDKKSVECWDKGTMNCFFNFKGDWYRVNMDAITVCGRELYTQKSVVHIIFDRSGSMTH